MANRRPAGGAGRRASIHSHLTPPPHRTRLAMNKLIVVALVAAFAVVAQVSCTAGGGGTTGTGNELQRAGQRLRGDRHRIFLPVFFAPRNNKPLPTTHTHTHTLQAAAPAPPPGTVRQWSKWATDAAGNKYEWGAFVDAAGTETPWGTQPPSGAGEADKPVAKKGGASAAVAAGEASEAGEAGEAGESVVVAPKPSKAKASASEGECNGVYSSCLLDF